MTTELRTDHLVVGSGAGGALTAARLAEAGREVLVVEEGDWVPQGEVAAFSLDQMDRQYRYGGLSAALGRPPLAYVEGCCAGGGTEVNSGLYHRPPAALLSDWARRLAIPALSEADLAPHAEEIERSLSVQPYPHEPPRASTMIVDGARKLGWASQEVPRWFRYDDGTARKQSMTETYLPRARRAGAEIRTGARVERLLMRRGRAHAARVTIAGRPTTVRAKRFWVCGGAIETAALLQRSGIRRGIGTSLRAHPTVKIAARFDEPLGGAADVPVHQVKEFAPDISFGGSASRPGYVALALADNWHANRAVCDDWARVGVYYAAIRSQGHGRVIAVPGVADPVVTYRLTRRDLSVLGSALARLGLLLLAAGARELYPSLRSAEPVTTARQLPRLRAALSRGTASLMTVHLTSTVPLGGPVDAFGRLRAAANVVVNDASLLPEAPGVNPQGTVMALASRNVARHLAQGDA